MGPENPEIMKLEVLDFSHNISRKVINPKMKQNNSTELSDYLFDNIYHKHNKLHSLRYFAVCFP